VEALKSSLIIALGAALGANARYWFGEWFSTKWSNPIPLHTLLINVSGSLLLGIFMAISVAKGWGNGWKLLVAVGFAGGFTTFSTFSAETMNLIRDGKVAECFAYILLSVLLSAGGCFAGYSLARTLV
jgi:CrcB protein